MRSSFVKLFFPMSVAMSALVACGDDGDAPGSPVVLPGGDGGVVTEMDSAVPFPVIPGTDGGLPRDAGNVGTLDAQVDAAAGDASTGDASTADASTSDASTADASADGGPGDASTADAGPGDGGPAGDAGPDCSSTTYENFGRTLMSTYCTGCHNGTQAGRPNLTTVAGIRASSAAIKTAAVTGTAMPPFPVSAINAPSAADRAKLGQWLDCGAP
jgi:hypothetical protein